MKTSFSSAGLLYVYITGYKEMELLHIEHIDTYSYIGDELYNKIMEISEVMTQNENSIHVFGVIGIEKKVNSVYTILEEGMKKNFDRILNNRKIKIGTKNLDSIGNHFYRCVQEFYCALQETDIYKKGKKWENVAEYVLNSVEGWKITGKRIRAGAQEIDLSVANISLDDELWQMGAYILIECKNWKKHVGIQQIRNIAHISSMKGNKTAILFTANGITSDSQEEIQRLAMTNIYIICITAVELKQLQSAVECKKLILDKWKSLQDSIEVSGII